MNFWELLTTTGLPTTLGAALVGVTLAVVYLLPEPSETRNESDQ